VPSEFSSNDSRDPEQSPFFALLVVYLKGVAMGAADAVPGVSGGTIAFITGIYERLIMAVTQLDPRVLVHVPYVYNRDRRNAFRTALREMDVPFLVAVGTGMVTAIVIFARFVQAALSTVPAATFAFFFGLIGASALVLVDPQWRTQSTCLAAAVVGFSVAFLIAGASAGGAMASSTPVVFGSGMLAISGMVLPGISGAFILLLLGQYDHLTETLNEFVDAVVDLRSGNVTDPLVSEGAVVLTFSAGALVGLFSITFLVRWALERHRAATLAFLVSLMIGALRLPVLEVLDATQEWTLLAGLEVVTAGAVGAVVVFVLDHVTADLEY
jgi:putative membrane protein